MEPSLSYFIARYYIYTPIMVTYFKFLNSNPVHLSPEPLKGALGVLWVDIHEVL